MSMTLFGFDAQAALKQAREKIDAKLAATTATLLHHAADRSRLANVAAPPAPKSDAEPSPRSSGLIIDLAAHFGRAQREADRRNAAALREFSTNRWCRCGRLAALAWRIDSREVWRCDDCGKPTP